MRILGCACLLGKTALSWRGSDRGFGHWGTVEAIRLMPIPVASDSFTIDGEIDPSLNGKPKASVSCRNPVDSRKISRLRLAVKRSSRSNNVVSGKALNKAMTRRVGWAKRHLKKRCARQGTQQRDNTPRAESTSAGPPSQLIDSSKGCCQQPTAVGLHSRLGQLARVPSVRFLIQETSFPESRLAHPTIWGPTQQSDDTPSGWLAGPGRAFGVGEESARRGHSLLFDRGSEGRI